ncbi:MAG: hypothetical protein FWD32_01760 [Firmicutes bacterium]|nr:hypothetical protein [Bacillota bacterium]
MEKVKNNCYACTVKKPTAKKKPVKKKGMMETAEEMFDKGIRACGSGAKAVARGTGSVMKKAGKGLEKLGAKEK